MARAKAGFSTPEAARGARLTARQVGYWAKTRLVIPSLVDAAGSGNHRRYGFRDVFALRVLSAFRERGLSLQALRRVQHYLKHREESELQDTASRLVFVPGRARDVLLARTPQEIVSLLEKPGQFVAPVVVDVSALYRDVAARVEGIAEARRLKEEKRRAAEAKPREVRAEGEKVAM